MNIERTQQVLEKFGQKVISNARGILNAKERNASGKLASELDFEVKVYPSGALEMDFKAPSYAKFVDKGVRGNTNKPHPKRGMLAKDSPYQYGSKMPPVGKIDGWSVRKGIKDIRDERGRFVKRKSLIFAFAKSIQMYGLPASHFFTDAFADAYKNLPDQVVKAYANDVEKFLEFTTKNMK